MLNTFDKLKMATKGIECDRPNAVHNIKYANFRGTFWFFISIIDEL
jgi:hypothetical protein